MDLEVIKEEKALIMEPSEEHSGDEECAQSWATVVGNVVNLRT